MFSLESPHRGDSNKARSPACRQEAFWSPASQLSLALKSPANRLAGDLKVCQPDIGILINKLLFNSIFYRQRHNPITF